MQHDDPAYLEGLSDLDRARAIVAVRWCGTEWVKGDYGRYLGTPGSSSYGPTTSTAPINRFWHGILKSRGFAVPDWGTSWTGTASLMELAESKGWTLGGIDAVDDECHLPEPFVLLNHIKSGVDVEVNGENIHAAVLLACAEAAKREQP